MSLVREIKKEYNEIASVGELTSAFENIASTRIQQIKDKVLSSKDFFAELWYIYSQLRVLPKEGITHTTFYTTPKNNKEAVIVLTSKGKLSGDIDIKIINKLLEEVDPNAVDIISVGSHGKLLLNERGYSTEKSFIVPEGEYLDYVNEIIDFITPYSKISVYYETYISLAVQDVKKIDLIFAVKELSKEEVRSKKNEELIHKEDYIFEPSYQEVITYMESIMLKIALSQVLLESELAQQASRFKAMHFARDRANEIRDDLGHKYNKARRSEKDSRLREVIYSLNSLLKK